MFTNLTIYLAMRSLTFCCLLRLAYKSKAAIATAAARASIYRTFCHYCLIPRPHVLIELK